MSVLMPVEAGRDRRAPALMGHEPSPTKSQETALQVEDVTIRFGSFTPRRKARLKSYVSPAEGTECL